jgi:hypothetical protein
VVGTQLVLVNNKTCAWQLSVSVCVSVSAGDVSLRIAGTQFRLIFRSGSCGFRSSKRQWVGVGVACFQTRHGLLPLTAG